MLELGLQYVPDFVAASMEMRASKNAKYISLTCRIQATSKQQLDDLYRALTAHPMVVTVL